MYYVYKLGEDGKVIREETQNNNNRNIDQQKTLETLYYQQQNQQQKKEVIPSEKGPCNGKRSIKLTDENIKTDYLQPIINQVKPYEVTMSDTNAIKNFQEHLDDSHALTAISERISPIRIDAINEYFKNNLNKSPITVALEHYREGMYAVIFTMCKAGLKPTAEEIKYAETHSLKEITDIFNFNGSFDKYERRVFFYRNELEPGKIQHNRIPAFDIQNGILNRCRRTAPYETLNESQRDEKESIHLRLNIIYKIQTQTLKLQHLQQPKQQPHSHNGMELVDNGLVELLEMIVDGKEDKDLRESPAIKNYIDRNNHTIVSALIRYDRPSMLNHLSNTYPHLITTNISIHDLENARSIEAQHAVLNILNRRNQFDLNITDPKTGATALHRLVAKNADEKLVKNFLDKGANVNIKNKSGKTALDVAQRLNYANIVVTLTEHMQKNQNQPASTFEAIRKEKEALDETGKGSDAPVIHRYKRMKFTFNDNNHDMQKKDGAFP